jgi:hypothetical protein
MNSNHFTETENITVKTLTDDHDPLWEQIQPNDVFSIYHSKIWKDIIEDTFGHTASYIAASEHGQLIDVLPLFLVKNPFLGKKLVSTPYEGCHGSFSSSQGKARKLLIEKLLKDAYKWNVKYIEIRGKLPIDELKEYGFIEQTPFVISEIPLKSLDNNWHRLSANHRRNVRIAQKKGVLIEPASGWEDMKAFYKILADHYNKKIGVPFFGRKFFQQAWEKLVEKNQACLLLAKFEQEIIGGHLLFFSGKTLISKYSACKQDNEELRKVNASYLLFWEGIRLGIEKNFTTFNLGITGEHNTGLLDFKSRFGSKSERLRFYYYPVSGSIPDYAKYYDSYAFLKKMWKITPGSVTAVIGQKINEWIC